MTIDKFETASQKLSRELSDMSRVYDEALIGKTPTSLASNASIVAQAREVIGLSGNSALADLTAAGLGRCEIESDHSPAREAQARVPAFYERKPLDSKPTSLAIRKAADLGLLIRQARKAMKMTQSDFASHAGVGRRFLSELEGGKPSLEFDKVMACAQTAGINIFTRSSSGR